MGYRFYKAGVLLLSEEKAEERIYKPNQIGGFI